MHIAICNTFFIKDGNFKASDIINVMMRAKLKIIFFSLYIKNILGTHYCALLHFMAITKVQKTSLNCHSMTIYAFY